MADFHPPTAKGGQVLHHKGVEGVRALRTAHNQQATRAPLARKSAHGAHSGPHGVAGEHAFFRVKTFRIGQGKADLARQAGQQAVAHAGYGVLFVQQTGHAQQPRGQHGRKGRVAAKTCHGLGVKPPHQLERFAHGQRHATGRAHGPQPAPQESAHGQTRKRHVRQTGQTLFRAVLRTHKEQPHVRVAPPQFFRHGQSRKDVPAGAAGGQEDAVHGSAVLEKFMSSPTQSMVATRLLPP